MVSFFIILKSLGLKDIHTQKNDCLKKENDCIHPFSGTTLNYKTKVKKYPV